MIYNELFSDFSIDWIFFSSFFDHLILAQAFPLLKYSDIAVNFFNFLL